MKNLPEKIYQKKYLGVNINNNNNNKNDVRWEISEIIPHSNKYSHSIKKLLKFKLLSRKSLLYTSYLRLIYTYECETKWFTTKYDNKWLAMRKLSIENIFWFNNIPPYGTKNGWKNKKCRPLSAIWKTKYIIIPKNPNNIIKNRKKEKRYLL